MASAATSASSSARLSSPVGPAIGTRFTRWIDCPGTFEFTVSVNVPMVRSHLQAAEGPGEAARLFRVRAAAVQHPEGSERVMRARLVYWLPFTLLAVALAVVIYTVAHAAVVKALAPVVGG